MPAFGSLVSFIAYYWTLFYFDYPASYLEKNYEEFKLIRMNASEDPVSERGQEQHLKLPFMEKEFRGDFQERKQLFLDNFHEFKSFLENNNVMVNEMHLQLLAYLYKTLGFNKKEEIRNVISQTYYYNKKL